MVKTPDEYDIEIKQLHATHAGQLTQVNKELETANKQIEDLTAKLDAKDVMLHSFEKAERDEKEACFHAVIKDLSEDIKGKIPLLQKPLDKLTNDEIDAFTAGFEINKHATESKAPPKRGQTKPPAGTSGVPDKSKAESLLDA